MQVTETYDAYLPRGGHLKFWRCLNHSVMLCGPYQTGKTYTALSLLNYLAATTPKARILFCRKISRSLYTTVVPTWENKIVNGLVTDKPTGASIRRLGGNRPYEYQYPNGATIILGGLDNPDKILSAEYDYVYVNQAEEIKLGVWEVLKGRATGRAGATTQPQIFGDCNPGPPNHWILSDSNLELINTAHKDNPTLWDGEEWTELGKQSIDILKSLTGTRYKRGYLGEWAGSEGLVYEDDFDADKHVLNIPINPKWKFFISCDFGYRSPIVFQLWGVDTQKQMYLCKEIYTVGKTTHNLLPQLQHWVRTYRPAVLIADHDPEGQATLKKLGIPVRNAKKNIVQGIIKVKDFFADGRLWFLEDCLEFKDTSLHPLPACTLDEMLSYCYPENSLNDLPIDANNHGMDTMRYAVAFVNTL